MARRRDEPHGRGSVLAGEEGGGQARPLPRRRQPQASASEAGRLGGAASGGNRGMEAWEGVCRRRGSGGVGGELVARAGAAGAASERAGGGMRRRQRGRAEEGARVEGEAGHGCRSAGFAGAWSPRGGRALALVGTRRVGTARRSAEAGRAREVGWAEHGAGERQARRQAEPASAVGRERRRRPAKGENIFLIFYFEGNFK